MGDGGQQREKLNRRELLAVQGIASGMTATAALLQAGYAKSVATTQQQSVLGKPRVQNALAQALEDAGIGTKFIARALRRGLAAKRGIYQDGKLVAREPDHGNRHKYLTTALELRGDLERRREVGEETWESVLFQIRARRTESEPQT